MKKFKIPLSRAERAFIFFSIQYYTAPKYNKPDLEGLRICYLSVLFKIYRRGLDLFRTDDIDYSFTLAEVGAIYQMTNDTFNCIHTSEEINAARGIIWKMHPVLMRNQNNFQID